MNIVEKKKPSFDIVRVSWSLVIISALLVLFHFQNSCLASGRAGVLGGMVAVFLFFVGVVKKKGGILAAAILIIAAHMLLVH